MGLHQVWNVCSVLNMILTFKACVHIALCKYDLVWGWEAGESSAQCAGTIISPAQPSFWATSIQTPDINLGHKHHRKYWMDTHNRLYWPNQIFLSVPCNLCCKKPLVYYLWLIIYLFSPLFCFTALNPGILVFICLKYSCISVLSTFFHTHCKSVNIYLNNWCQPWRVAGRYLVHIL